MFFRIPICYSNHMNNRDFYKHVLRISIPIMIQNGITNFVGMLDNIMVGQIGTNSMSAVAIVNQLMFVFNLCIFGGLAGIGIFTAQFYGRRNHDGVRSTFRLMVMTALILSVAGIAVFLLAGEGLISLYLHEDGGVTSIAETMFHAGGYMKVMMIGMLPFAFTQVYSSTLRSTNETVVPMRAGLVAVFVNLIGNYVLIYGKFGFPQLGVIGAAAATVLSRFVELVFVAAWTHTHHEQNPFIVNAYASMHVPGNLTKQCLIKGTPLLINEFLWSASQAMLSQTYSYRGLSVIAAFNISQTIGNVFNIAFIALGSATGIIIGQELGARHFDTVKKDAERITWFTVGLCIFMGALLFAISGFFPTIYNTSDDIRELASSLIRVGAVCMPIYAYANAAYFILRSGGKTVITFLFDSCFCWLVSIPLAFFFVHYTDLPVARLYLFVQLADLLKCVIGFALVNSGYWINDITQLTA